MVFISYKLFMRKEFFLKEAVYYLVDLKSPGGRELSLSACPGVGNSTFIEEKNAIPRGCAGGMVTARIETCINERSCKKENDFFARNSIY